MIERLVVVAVVVAISTMVGRWWQSRQGRVRRVGNALVLGSNTGPVSALLFTTPMCRTCPQVRDNLAAVAAVHADFTWTEIDAAIDLDQARVHRVMRAPTLVFLAAGHEVARVQGVASAAAIAGAVGLDAQPLTSATVSQTTSLRDGSRAVARSA